MPIMIDRHTGKIISCPEITQQQRDALWEVIVRCYTQKHPEIFQQQQTAEGDNASE